MSTIWKIVIGLVLTLPIAAYVIGSLVTSTAELPAQREPVNIQNVSPSPTTDPHGTSRAPGDPRLSGSSAAPGDDDADDIDVDDNGVQIVNPEPTRVDEDADGRGDDGGDDDDDDGGDDDDDDEDDGRDD